MEECLIDAKQRHLPQSAWSSIDVTIASRQLTFVSWKAEGGKGGRIESSQPNTSKKDKGEEVSVDKEIVVDKPRRLMVAQIKGPNLIN